jgi:hypothetical protein
MLGNNAHKFTGNTAAIINVYQTAVQNNFVNQAAAINVGAYFGAPGNQIVLDCWVHPGHSVPRFRWQGKNYQYDLRNSGYGRPNAWRVPFLNDPNYGDARYMVSHLCHNKHCYNWNHHTLELLDVNKGRNGCPGGLHCHHIVQCIRPGLYFDM